MLRIYIILLLLVFSSCRTKYDTSKAVAILEENQITPDYRLKKETTEFDTTDRIVNVKEYKPTLVQNLPVKPNNVFYKNGFLYAVSKNKLLALNLKSNDLQEIQHEVENPKVTATEGVVLVFNTMGKFAFIDIAKQNIIWDGVVETNSLASEFVCVESTSSCYALTIDGEIATLDYENLTKKANKMFQKTDIILNEIYTPLVIEDKIIFAVGQSEFAIFDASRNMTLAQSSFVEENSSLFDVNLVQNIYKGGDNVIISHINGSYAFNMLYGRPLWVKKLVFNRAFVSSNYAIFYEEKTQKLMSLHLNSGEIKWAEDLAFSPIDIDINYNKELVVLASNGVHLFNLETGAKIDFKKIDMQDIDYTFVDDHQIYYASKAKIYKIQ